MSNLRRPWRLVLVLVVIPSVALAAACGPPDAAGVRASQSGSGGGVGSGGSSDASADGTSNADGTAPFHGGACIDDVGIAGLTPVRRPAASPGPGVNGVVCTGGAFAYVQSTPAPDGGAPQIALYIDNVDIGAAGDRIRFADPANALAGDVHIDIGLATASAGTYDATQTCGSVVLNVDLPVPATVNCATDASVSSDADCPPGCQATGSFSGPACAPLEPEITYAATASSDCVGDSTTPEGSWTLTLTSVAPYPEDAGSGDSSYYQVHGNLASTLANQAADAGTANVSITLSF